MAKTLDELREKLSECRGCGLCESRTNVVFGTGCPSPGILLIGEGRGKNEDEQGEPFVGRSGQLMDKMLEYVGLSRKENIYIANIVKCRPPQNRDPAPEEISACIGHLREQTALINPRIIVCVGRISACTVISKDFKVTKDHGVFYKRGNYLLMGTFHPAALLRNPALKGPALEDMLLLRAKAEELGLLPRRD